MSDFKTKAVGVLQSRLRGRGRIQGIMVEMLIRL